MKVKKTVAALIVKAAEKSAKNAVNQASDWFVYQGKEPKSLQKLVK